MVISVIKYYRALMAKHTSVKKEKMPSAICNALYQIGRSTTCLIYERDSYQH